MARPRAKLDRSSDGPLVKTRLNREKTPWKRERLIALNLGLKGEHTLEQIAEALGQNRSSIQLWFDAFRRGGMGALLAKDKGNGPASQLTPEIAEALKLKLRDDAFRAAAQAHRWLCDEHGMKVGLRAV